MSSFPAARHTMNGVYDAKTDSFLEPIQNLLAAEPSPAAVAMVAPAKVATDPPRSTSRRTISGAGLSDPAGRPTEQPERNRYPVDSASRCRFGSGSRARARAGRGSGYGGGRGGGREERGMASRARSKAGGGG